MKHLCILVVAALTACASSSGVVPAGNGTFVVARSEKGFATTGARVRADALREAAAHCTALGKQFQVIDAPASDMKPFRSDAQAEVTFTCAP